MHTRQHAYDYFRDSDNLRQELHNRNCSVPPYSCIFPAAVASEIVHCLTQTHRLQILCADEKKLVDNEATRLALSLEPGLKFAGQKPPRPGD